MRLVYVIGCHTGDVDGMLHPNVVNKENLDIPDHLLLCI